MLRKPKRRNAAPSLTGVDLLLAAAQQLQNDEVIEGDAAELFIQLLMNGFVIPQEHLATATMATSRQIACAPINKYEDAACRIVATAIFLALDRSADQQTQAEILVVGLSELVKYRDYLASMGRPTGDPSEPRE